MAEMRGEGMELWALHPELILSAALLVLVPLAGWVRGPWRRLPSLVALLALLAALGTAAAMVPWEPLAIFGGTYAVDPFGSVLKLLILAGALLSLLLLGNYFRRHEAEAQAPPTLLFATLGAVGTVSALDLGVLFLFLQMMSIGSYLLVALVRKQRPAAEAALKFFLYGAVALAVMAYGLSFLYGLTGSLDLRAIGEGLRGAEPAGVALATGLVLVGFAFEATLVPFHLWAPDVYEGSSAPAAGFLSVVPKIAAFGALMRFLLLALPGGLAAWPVVLAVLAAATMTLGNLVALRQSRLKRLLAWSTVAQGGYLLMAVAVSGRNADAAPAVGYYLAAYLFMNLGAFAVVAQVERALGTDALAAFRGLAWRAPGPAAALALCLFSLAGIPPLAGFAGKVMLLGAAMDGGAAWLAVLAAVNMAVGLFFYAGVAGQMYLNRSALPDRIATGRGFGWGVALAVAGTLALGLFPGPGARLMEGLRLLVG